MGLLRHNLMNPMVSRGSGGAFDNYAVDGNSPPLVADFVRQIYQAGSVRTSFSDLFTFARLSDATFLGSNGLLQTASSGDPRVGSYRYENGVLVPIGMTAESEARTNIVVASEDFSDAQWIPTRSSVSANATTAPDGTTTADKLVEDSSNSTHLIQDNIVKAASAIVYEHSCFMKAGERDFARMLVSGTPSSNGFHVDINLLNGTTALTTFGTGWTVHTYGAEQFADGWWRPWAVATSDTSTLTKLSAFLADSFGNTSYQGDGASGIYLWGGQICEGDSLSSYIKTTGSSATRAAESATIAAADLPYSAAAMTLALKGRVSYIDSNNTAEARLLRWFDDSNNNIEWYLNTGGSLTGDLRAFQEVGGVTDAAIGASQITPGFLKSFNLAARHGATLTQAANDGVAGTLNSTPASLPNLSATDLKLADFDFTGSLETLRMWDADLGTSGIEEASA